MNKKIIISVIAIAAAVALVCAAAAVLFATGVFNPRHVYKNESINALLKSSKDKTVENDIINKIHASEQVKVGEKEEEYQDFSYFHESPKTVKRTVDVMEPKYGFLSKNLKSDGSEYTYDDIMSLEPNGFLKENRFGELYTVFKDSIYGDYYYVFMKVWTSGDDEKIVFDRVYPVNLMTIYKKELFDKFEIGKTSLAELNKATGNIKKESSLTSGISLTGFNLVKIERPISGIEVTEGNTVLIPRKTEIERTFLTTEGIMNITLTFDESLGSYIVSAKDFQEGCPVNPEDII